MGRVRQVLKFNSLRLRYLVLTLSLATVAIGVIWGSQRYIINAGDIGSRHIAQRNEVNQHILQIKSAFRDADNAIDMYMMSPASESRTRLHKHLTHALAHIESLAEKPWIKDNQLQQHVRNMIPTMEIVRDRAVELMEIRLDADAMYPAMRVANGAMLRANQVIQSGIDLAILESREVGSEKDPRVLNLLTELRNAWNRMISAYRLYLINRLGSLFESGLQTQASDVDLHFSHVAAVVRQLQTLSEQGHTEFQTTTSIEDIAGLIPVWHADYKKVVEINNTEHWRSDIPLIRNVLKPLWAELRGNLDYLDEQISRASEADIQNQLGAARFVSLVLWVLAATLLLGMAAGYVLFLRKLLIPVAQVTKGLRDEAKGHMQAILPKVHTEEIRYLVDAFTEMRKQVHSRQTALEHQAMHDSLTALPNRALLLDRLNHAIKLAHRDQGQLALMLVDLNRFKEINDTLGHQAGDELLQQVAQRLHILLRETDTVARLGGDEFAIVLPEIDQQGIERVAAKIIHSLEKEYLLGEHHLYIGASIGVALYPMHGEHTEELIRHADIAMYNSKRTNTSFSIYDTERDAHNVNQLSLLTDLRKAIEDNKLELYFQPKVKTATNEVLGVEALLRWHHPKHGFIPPDQFIPLTEQTGLIRRLSNWVIDRALRQIREWCDEGHELTVSINLSVWDLQDTTIAEVIAERLQRWNVPANLLELEITESAMMLEPERARETLTQLARQGILLAIDDYGVGFSSLAYLKQLPVARLKIDKSFVLDMAQDENDEVIVRSTVDLAHNLGLEVVAEGVENAETANLLQVLRCDYLQGYHISRPLPADKLRRWLDAAHDPNSTRKIGGA